MAATAATDQQQRRCLVFKSIQRRSLLVQRKLTLDAGSSAMPEESPAIIGNAAVSAARRLARLSVSRPVGLSHLRVGPFYKHSFYWANEIGRRGERSRTSYANVELSADPHSSPWLSRNHRRPHKTVELLSTGEVRQQSFCTHPPLPSPPSFTPPLVQFTDLNNCSVL